MNFIKNSTRSAFAAFAAGVVAFSFANASFTAEIPYEILLSIGTSLGLLGIAGADYGRTNRSLVPRAALLRPDWNVSATHPPRVAAGNNDNAERRAA
jgi:hypothetical protein